MKQTVITKLPLHNLSAHDHISLKGYSNPRFSNTIPSIIATWHNHQNACNLLIEENFALIRCHEYEKKPYWSASGKLCSDNDARLLNELIATEKIKELKYCPDLFVTSLVQFRDYLPDITINSSSSDSHDYIYDIGEVLRLQGKKYEELRRGIRHFAQLYEDKTTTITLDKLTETTKNDYLRLYEDWMIFGTNGANTSESEMAAINSFFDEKTSPLLGEILLLELYFKEKLVGTAICEIINQDYALAHFQKTNLNLSGVTKYLFYSVTKALSEKGIKYLNYQEDLGIKGLRDYKMRLGPSSVGTSFNIRFD